ncbi:MAG: glycosyltransferase [Bifidobacteriaceae bacterium]|jgi:glycosyltransferase involved in cell wall biosynthesis|nr:glycosyltransferase [Bifidobacteriaceae bacterium]
MRKIKTLQITPQFQPGGGIDRVVMNYMQSSNPCDISFDILTHKCDDRIYANSVESRGGKVFLLPEFSVTNLPEIVKKFETILIEGHYDVVHCHMANAAFLYLRIAKKHHVPIRVLHSHQDHYADSLTHSLRNIPLIEVGKHYANCDVACAKKAGDFLFPKSEYTILRNAIDTEQFCFSPTQRKAFRAKNSLRDSDIVFGFVGRLVEQKNPLFLIEVFSKLQEKRKQSYLVVAGDGDLRPEMMRKSERLGLKEHIIWLGNIEDTSPVYSGIDALLMPSLYEGLSMTLVEAQASGLSCFVSDAMSSEAFLTSMVHPLQIKEGTHPWVQAVDKYLEETETDSRIECSKAVADAGFDIQRTAEQLEDIYRDWLGREEDQ